ncbi:MAG: class I SAM-dependent methyltransferase [Bacillota bacterium]|nr:class I SAM-dependent methyltransferase [Bacillota bacterium]
MDNIYNFPQYYDLAFAYRNYPREVDIMEEAIEKYSEIPVNTVLELACGNSPHMLEFANRGFHYKGLDLSSAMLDFSKKKAEDNDFSAQFYQANLVDFKLEEPVDFLYVMLGSLYVGNTEELLSHFASAQSALKPGGLYFLDWCVDFSPLENTLDSWVTRKGRVSVTTQYSTKLKHAGEQLYEENLIFTVKDHGEHHKFYHRGIRRAIYPQELFVVATKLHNFEFIGWWNDWDWNQPIGEEKGEIVRPITVLRLKP